MTHRPRTFLITGASRGIGRAVALHLVGDGHRVLAACRRPSASADLADAGAVTIELDVTDPASIDALVANVTRHVEHLDVVVNNAGIKVVSDLPWSATAGPLAEVDPDAVAALLRTNLIGPLSVTQAVEPLLASPGGIVVNVSSALGSLQEHVGLDYAYNCSKAALNMLSAQLHRDLAPTGRGVVALNPGWIKTDMAGDEAPLELSVASREIADLLSNVSLDHGGRFVDRFGVDFPW